MGNGQAVEYDRDKVLPEYMLVKQEILRDFFYLKDLMFEAQRRATDRSLDMIRAQMLVLYATIRSKKGISAKCKDILKIPEMQKLAAAVTKDDLNLPLADLFHLFLLLQKVLDVLGLTQITYSSKDPNRAYDY